MKENLIPLFVISLASTVIVMAVTGMVAERILSGKKTEEERRRKEMTFLQQSLYLGFVISILAYLCGVWLKKKLGWAILNPLLVSGPCDWISDRFWN